MNFTKFCKTRDDLAFEALRDFGRAELELIAMHADRDTNEALAEIGLLFVKRLEDAKATYEDDISDPAPHDPYADPVAADRRELARKS